MLWSQKNSFNRNVVVFSTFYHVIIHSTFQSLDLTNTIVNHDKQVKESTQNRSLTRCVLLKFLHNWRMTRFSTVPCENLIFFEIFLTVYDMKNRVKKRIVTYSSRLRGRMWKRKLNSSTDPWCYLFSNVRSLFDTSLSMKSRGCNTTHFDKKGQRSRYIFTHSITS